MAPADPQGPIGVHRLSLALTAIVAQIRQAPASFGNARDRVGGHHAPRSTPAAGSFRAREEKIRCGNAWRESRILRHNPTNQRTASLCQDCLERRSHPEARPQEKITIMSPEFATITAPKLSPDVRSTTREVLPGHRVPSTKYEVPVLPPVPSRAPPRHLVH